MAWLDLNIRHAWPWFTRQSIFRDPTQPGCCTAEPEHGLWSGVYGGMPLDHHALDRLPGHATVEHETDPGIARDIFHFLGAGPAAQIDVIA